jgi:hypothetical protein
MRGRLRAENRQERGSREKRGSEIGDQPCEPRCGRSKSRSATNAVTRQRAAHAELGRKAEELKNSLRALRESLLGSRDAFHAKNAKDAMDLAET